MINNILNTAEIAHGAAPKLKELRKAADGIESMFVKDLLAAMRKGMPESKESGFGGEIYKDMFDNALAEKLGKTGSLKIGDLLYKQLSKGVAAQEAARIRMTKEQL